MDEKNTHLENEDLTNKEEETTNVDETVKAEDAETSETNTTEDTEENVTDINSKLEEKKLKDELAQANDQYMRLQAEYANYRRRTQEEKETIGLYAKESMMKGLIDVIDSMERALGTMENKEDSVYQGIDLVYKQLKDTLSKNGLEEIEAENQEFDPNVHLAVMQESVDGVEANKVVGVLQKGYKVGNKVIRATMVKVSC